MIRKLLVIVGLFLVALLVSPIHQFLQKIGEQANFNHRTLAHLSYIGSTFFHRYHAIKGHLPPAYIVDSNGKKLHSWRTLVLEVEYPELFAKIKLSEPWNSDHNKQFESQMPFYYLPPGNYDVVRNNKYVTNYVVFVDESSAFPGANSISFRDITNDKDSTILIVEAPGFDVHWMEPVDFDKKTFLAYYEENWRSYTKKGNQRPGLLMTDNFVKYNPGYSLTELSQMFSIRKGQKIQGLGDQ